MGVGCGCKLSCGFVLYTCIAIDDVWVFEIVNNMASKKRAASAESGVLLQQNVQHRQWHSVFGGLTARRLGGALGSKF